MTKVSATKGDTPLFGQPIPPPDFQQILSKPIVSVPLPTDFGIDDETKHLRSLWENNKSLQRYRFEAFVHAGGSGMVFKVLRDDSTIPWALKVVRHKLYSYAGTSSEVATSLSPVSDSELKALQRLSHPNVVRLLDALSDAKGVFAICTSYVASPQPLDEYIRGTLAKKPRAVHPFSSQRIDGACQFLIARSLEIASALKHMHDQGMFHFDVKPNNILIPTDKGAAPAAMLTDMGACIHADSLTGNNPIRVHFTWTYAHPDLTTIVNDPGSLTGGGLKASAAIIQRNLEKYDLFAFGKTLQELLAVLEEEFRERCHASYGFRFLHVIACLLLDGHNAPNKKESRWSNIVTKHGKRFANDVALDYPPELFESHKITSTAELVDRLDRFSKKYSWNDVAPEMDAWQRETINSVAHSPAPFTARVAAIFNHPCFRRLKSEPQLGWMREVFPGSTHDRWAHSLGVFSALVTYFQSLLADSEVPTFRLLVNEKDLDHAFVAAILHDLGQTAFGHDMEEACRFIYSHDDYVEDLLDENHWGSPTLREAIREHWPDVDITRVLSILRPAIDEGHKSGVARTQLAIDGLSSDVINGPIDADKLDYLLRDSIACGVPYGHGIDVPRFLRCLTVTAKSMRDGTSRLALAYKAKGRAAILSVLMARYQMWGAVYWHHTFRCIQAMFVHSAAATFEGEWKGTRKFGETRLRVDDVRRLFYWRVIVGKSWNVCVGKLAAAKALRDTQEPPGPVHEERVLDLLWRLAPLGIRQLIEMLASRKLYKRVFEMRLGEMGPRADYSAMKAAMTPTERAAKARTLQQRLLDTVDKSMRERGPSESIAEETARTVLAELRKKEIPLVLLDFPVRGVSDERNTPSELGDAVRKYFVLPKGTTGAVDDVFDVVRKLQQNMATVRIFAFPELHELIIRYLSPESINDCVESVIEQLRTNQ